MLWAVVNWGDFPTWLAVFGGFAAAGAALWQLQLQRIQLTDQTRIQERLQADAIDVTASSIDGVQAGLLPSGHAEQVILVMVTNGSKRPIRDVACKVAAIQVDQTTHEKPADLHGEIWPPASGPNAQPEKFFAQGPGPVMSVLRVGHGGICMGLYYRAVPDLRSMGQVH